MKGRLITLILICASCTLSAQSNFDELYQRGIKYYGEGKFALAVVSFSKILNDGGYDFKNALFLRAKAYSKTGRNAEAIQDLDKAIKYHPDSLTFYDIRAYAYSYVGDFIGAIRDYSKVMRLGGDSIKYLLLRSEVKMHERDYSSGLEDCDLVLKIQSQSSDAYKQKGKIFLMKKNNEDAIHQLDRSLQIDPKDAETYFFRTIAKIKRNDLPGASEDYKQAVRFDPTYNDPNIIRGIEFYLDREFEKACNAWRASLKMSKPVASELRAVYCNKK